ncbi:hypothetical protein CVT25_008665 [Psilocybe cyanescens]|uniref:Uncharacterized protein n=1 Tax=Psilocybe cyanescens TaxID=93625 RepID=A0A409XNZ2_PSICY|nr:hypothetical protein CVT25_008665 [Psilocybe cyanescens]
MPALRVVWIFASIAFGSALLASAQTLNSTVQKEYDTVCQDTAKKNGIKNIVNWAIKMGKQAPGSAAVHRAATFAALPEVVAGKDTAGPDAVPVSPWSRGLSGVTLRRDIAKIIAISPAMLTLTAI